ncbi:sensor histidine kinase [Paenibacillus spongiae]|uniref:histidine kinase n=1 Tax=Paenibacillus spongiae TaxID=2909671 RepID=A0ABY5SAK4_9BACL|nr:sensor histidine kinase [Paenibacillus spongiae]UVI29748.1 sensor histidine kinase [Paenibacillus spongiae]
MNVRFRTWKHWSVGSKVLALLFAVLLLSSVLLFQATSWLTQKAVREFMYNYVMMNQEKAQTGFEFLLGEVNMLSVRLLTKREVYRAVLDSKATEEQKEAAIAKILDAMNINTSVVRSIAIVTEDGRYYGYGGGADVGAPDPFFLKRVRESNTPVWGDVRRDGEGQPYLMLGRKYYNFNTGQRLGYLVVYIRERALYDVYKNMVFSDWGNAMLLSEDRYVLSAPDPAQAGTAIYEPELFQVGGDGYKMTELKGDPAIIFNYRLTGDVQKNGLNWHIVSMVSQQELFKRLGHIKRYAYVLQAVLIAAGFAVSWYVSKRIVTPVNRLARIIRKYRESGSTARPYVQWQNNDELALLENSFNDMVVRIEELIARNNEDKDRQRETELIALQAQINPHFLYNTLDAIGWIAKMNDQPTIERMIIALASFYRLSLHKGDKYITVKEELGIIKSYMTLEEMRFPDKFEVTYEVDEEITDDAVLKIILQPLVENAIKHGIGQKRGKGQLRIKGYRDRKDLVFEVQDDGIGFDPAGLHGMQQDTSYKGGGYGIRNVDERIKLEYGSRCGIQIDSSHGRGTTVTVRVEARNAPRRMS